MAFSFLENLCLFQRYLRFCIMSDGIIGGSTNTVQQSISNISSNIRVVPFKLDIRNVHHKRSKMTPVVPLP